MTMTSIMRGVIGRLTAVVRSIFTSKAPYQEYGHLVLIGAGKRLIGRMDVGGIGIDLPCVFEEFYRKLHPRGQFPNAIVRDRSPNSTIWIGLPAYREQ